MHTETLGLIDRQRKALEELLVNGPDRAWQASTDKGTPNSYVELVEAVFKSGYMSALLDTTKALREAAGWGD